MNRKNSLLLLSFLVLVGCGQSGELYLPDQMRAEEALFERHRLALQLVEAEEQAVNAREKLHQEYEKVGMLPLVEAEKKNKLDANTLNDEANRHLKKINPIKIRVELLEKKLLEEELEQERLRRLLMDDENLPEKEVTSGKSEDAEKMAEQREAEAELGPFDKLLMSGELTDKEKEMVHQAKVISEQAEAARLLARETTLKLEEAHEINGLTDQLEIVSFNEGVVNRLIEEMDAFQEKADGYLQRHQQEQSLRAQVVEQREKEAQLRAEGKREQADEALKALNRTRFKLGRLILEQQRSK